MELAIRDPAKELIDPLEGLLGIFYGYWVLFVIRKAGAKVDQPIRPRRRDRFGLGN